MLAADGVPCADLMVRARTDESAFAAIYRQYRAPVFALVYRRTRCRLLADELTADTFAKAWMNIRAFDPAKGTPLAWLYTIARNLVADHRRLAHVRYETPAAEVLVESIVDKTATGIPEDTAISNISFSRIRRAIAAGIAQMPDQQASRRQVLYLRFVEGRSRKEVAAAIGKTPSAAKGLEYHGLPWLRAYLTGGLVK